MLEILQSCKLDHEVAWLCTCRPPPPTHPTGYLRFGRSNLGISAMLECKLDHEVTWLCICRPPTCTTHLTGYLRFANSSCLTQNIFWTKKFFWTKKLFWTQNLFLYPKFPFGPKNFFGPKFFSPQKDLVWFYTINLPNQNLLNQRLSKLNTLDLSLVLYFWFYCHLV